MSLLSQFRFKPLQANVDSYGQSVTLIKLPEQAVRGSIKKVESGTQLNVGCELVIDVYLNDTITVVEAVNRQHFKG